MKYIINLILLLLLMSGTALADNFQIAFLQGTSSSYIAYSSVRVFDRNNKQVFTGSTDKYGRIIVNNLANGSYWIVIDFRGKGCRKAIAIDHGTAFKIINLVPADLTLNGLSSPAAPAFTRLSGMLSFHQLFYPCS